MAENIPPPDLPGAPAADAGDSPPEPETPNSSSRRAVRGSPVPTTSSAQISDPVPDPFSSSSSSASLPTHPAAVPVPAAHPPTVAVDARPPQPSLPELPTLNQLASSSRAFVAPAEQGGTGTGSSTPVGHPSDPEGLQVNADHLNQLLDIGFEESVARLALLRTANNGVEAAVQWIVDRSNESDYAESGDEEEEDDPMGGVQSAAAAALGGRTHKMVLVTNTSLKMGTGKLAAQVGHATLNVYRAASATEEGRTALEGWRRHGEVKIVVKGESTEQLMDLFKTAKDAGLYAYIVQDAGYTQIPPGSRTVLGVFGPVQTVDAVTGHLKLL